MTLLTWSHECIVGVQAMDDQHGVLLDTLNELRLLLVQGGERSAIVLQLKRLLELTRMHFHCEEELLVREGFPGVDQHRAAHTKLLASLGAALEQVSHDEVFQFSAVLAFLPAWYMEHLQELDQPYGLWLNERGVY